MKKFFAYVESGFHVYTIEELKNMWFYSQVAEFVENADYGDFSNFYVESEEELLDFTLVCVNKWG